MSTFLTIADAQEILRLSRSSINRLLDRGEIGHVHIGRAVRIPLEDVEAFIQRIRARE